MISSRTCLRRASRHWHRTLIALIGLVILLFLQPVQAHLMVAQRGTLNLVGSGGFVVMSIPVDALSGVDDDGDGLLSMVEMQAHSSDIQSQVQRGLQLHDESGQRPLQALMIYLSPDDRAPTAPAAQLVALGRFALADSDGSTTSSSLLTLRFTLFGKTAATQQQNIVITQGILKQQLVLTPASPERPLFPPARMILWDNAVQGAQHVLGGMDHLLFLLVVLATGWGWRQVVLALTCFTAGHAITLAASALGGWTAPSAVVEPAIAATLIGLALFDRWSRQRTLPWPHAVRLGLVFAAALIHGLGLATALTDLGLDTQHRLLSLAGFNLGIEAGQVAVAMLAMVLLKGIRFFKGDVALSLITQLASYVAMAAGTVWLAQRIAVSF